MTDVHYMTYMPDIPYRQACKASVIENHSLKSAIGGGVIRHQTPQRQPLPPESVRIPLACPLFDIRRRLPQRRRQPSAAPQPGELNHEIRH